LLAPYENGFGMWIANGRSTTARMPGMGQAPTMPLSTVTTSGANAASP
jgi:hypothetical protein